MAKYYVESGSFRGIVDVADAEMAAVWAIHRVMTVPTSPKDQRFSYAANDLDQEEQGLFRLADAIATCERGFGGPDSVSIPTRHAFTRWAQLVYAMEKCARENN